MTELDALAGRVANGDSDAPDELLVRSEPTLQRFARRSCSSDDDDAKDAVHIR